MAKIKITLTKSLIARKKNHIATANSLGLRKPGDFKVIDSNPAVEGKIKLISHLISVQDAE